MAVKIENWKDLIYLEEGESVVLLIDWIGGWRKESHQEYLPGLLLEMWVDGDVFCQDWEDWEMVDSHMEGWGKK